MPERIFLWIKVKTKENLYCEYIRKDGTNRMDENTQVKFDEKIKELLNLAKKKKNVLE